ncbi:MAG: hypothetical protein HY913_06290 [Desulfomonile tiedjei]|nr:hypothetical protein [Desulfomonile tiedjei]
MASITDLCWTSAEELFRDLDLDVLYTRQIRAVGAEYCTNYPYLLLVYTGKITIGISLGPSFESSDGARRSAGDKERHGHDGPYSPWHPRKEPPE